MRVAVVIAYVDRGCPHRRASYELVLEHYFRHLSEIILVGDVDPFSRAAAINRGVERTGADVIVQTDPDSMVPEGPLMLAIDEAGRRDGLVTPFTEHLYLSELTTAEVLTGRRDVFEVDSSMCDESGSTGVGNVAVFSRRTWEVAGGFDERFGTWGGDDRAFAYAAGLAGPGRRIPGPMVHLWHPRLEESLEGHPEHERSRRLVEAWRNADRGGPEALRAYIGALRAPESV